MSLRLFVSHAWEDKEFALTLFQRMDSIKPWIDIRELSGGQKLDSSIAVAIEESHVFVVLVSHHACTKDWVLKEARWALDVEDKKDRIFVIPIVIDADIDISNCTRPLNELSNRIYIDGSDRTATGIENTRTNLLTCLFRWACDWIDTVEPTGDSGARFVHTIEANLAEYQTSLYSIKALLSWPLEVLAHKESKQLMIDSQKTYSELTEQLLPSLREYEDEIRWRFGVSTQKAFSNLSRFIRDNVFHGAAFAMNDIVESVNAYDALIQHDSNKLEQARTIQQQRIETLDLVLQDLTRRNADFFSTIK